MTCRLLRLARSFTVLVTLTLSPFVNAEGPNRVSFGDVNSAFNTFLVGVKLMTGSGPIVPQAAPADGFNNGRIFPLQEDGASYCETDWILVNLGIFDLKSQYADRAEATAAIGSVTLGFWLDAVQMTTVRTPTRGSVTPSGDVIWYENEGFFLEPGSLNPGTHVLDTNIYDQASLIDSLQVWFEVLSADDPACNG